jgi:hypothetical protein
MKKVKDILENYSVRNCKTQIDSDRMSLLCEAGLFDENTLRMAKRAYEKSPSNMTMAEKTAILEVTDALLAALVVEKKDHLAAFDKKASKAVSEKDMPTVIILKRKAIRVFPDNQKIGLYYSQALDKYVSIPFGPEDKHSGTHLNEALGYKRPDKKTRRGKKIINYRNNITPMYYGREGNYDSEMIKAAKTPMLRTKKRTPEQISAFRRIVRAEVVKGNIAGALGLQIAHWATSAINAVKRNFGRKTPKLSRRIPAPAETHSDVNTQQEPPPTIPGLDGKPKTKIGGARPMATNRPVPALRMKESFFNNLNLIREQVLKQNPDTFKGPEGGGPNKPDPGPLSALGVVGGAVVGGALRAGGIVASRVLGRTASSAPNVLSTGATPAAEAARRITSRQAANVRLQRIKSSRTTSGRGPGVATGAAGGLAAGGALDNITGGGKGENLLIPTGGHSGTFTPGGSSVADQIAGRRTPVALVPKSYGGGVNALGGPIGFNESVISQAKALLSEGKDVKVITIKENTINLHKNVAKKLIKVYESLNNTNRKKFEKMLNEDAVSFKKALQFALRN